MVVGGVSSVNFAGGFKIQTGMILETRKVKGPLTFVACRYGFV